MSVDTHFREVALRTRSVLAIEPIPDLPDPHQRGRNSGRVLVAAAAVVLAVLVGSLVYLNQLEASERAGVASEVEVTESTGPPATAATTTSTEATTTTEVEVDPSLTSTGLPIEVSPQTDLRDGDLVTVTGEGFPPNTAIYITQCTPLTGPVAGQDRCMVNRFTTVNSDQDGRFTATHEVLRVVTIRETDYDCASPPPDGERSACTLAAAALGQQADSGVIPLLFDPDSPVRRRPTIVAGQTEGLLDFQAVPVTVLDPGTDTWWVNQCVTAATGPRCVGDALVGLPSRGLQSASGEPIAGTIIVRRWIGDVDCAAADVTCSIVAEGSSGEIITQRFDMSPEGGLAPPVGIHLGPGPHEAGASPVKVQIDGLVAGEVAGNTWLCPTGAQRTEGCLPAWGQAVTTTTGVSVDLQIPAAEIRTPSGPIVGCATEGACELTLTSSAGQRIAAVPIVVVPGPGPTGPGGTMLPIDPPEEAIELGP